MDWKRRQNQIHKHTRVAKNDNGVCGQETEQRSKLYIFQQAEQESHCCFTNSIQHQDEK